jgi:hypothetical protein
MANLETDAVSTASPMSRLAVCEPVLAGSDRGQVKRQPLSSEADGLCRRFPLYVKRGSRQD